MMEGKVGNAAAAADPQGKEKRYVKVNTATHFAPFLPPSLSSVFFVGQKTISDGRKEGREIRAMTKQQRFTRECESFWHFGLHRRYMYLHYPIREDE